MRKRLASYHAISSSGPYVSPVVPALAAYSHSASAGNRTVPWDCPAFILDKIVLHH